MLWGKGHSIAISTHRKVMLILLLFFAFLDVDGEEERKRKDLGHGSPTVGILLPTSFLDSGALDQEQEARRAR